jgi:glutathione S-transferase
LGELPRLVLAAAGRSFIDDRIHYEVRPDGSKNRGDWDSRKPLMPYGQVPVLGFKGELIPQSQAIVRFLARRHNLAGSGEVESALIDAAHEHVWDLRRNYFSAKGHPDREKTFWETTLPQALALLEKNVKGEKYIGKSNALSYADLSTYYLMVSGGQKFCPQWNWQI